MSLSYVEALSGQHFVPSSEAMIPPRKKVLIVDDEDGYRDIGEVNLLGQFDVSVSATGRDAIEVAKKVKPDIVLLDMQLPDMTGDQVAEKIAPEGRGPIVLFMSAGKSDLNGSPVMGKEVIFDSLNLPKIVRSALEMNR